MRLLLVLAGTAILAADAETADAHPLQKGLQAFRTAIPMTVRYGNRDLLREMAPLLVRELPTAGRTTRQETVSAFFRATLARAGTPYKGRRFAELTLTSGKLKVDRSFWLGPLEVKVGEFDLHRWAFAAGGAYYVCSEGKPLSGVSYLQMERCARDAYKAGAKAFGWKDPAAGF